MVCGPSSVISMVFHSGRVFRAAPGHWSGNTECRSRDTPFRWISRFTVMLRHRFTKSLSVYTDWAMTANGPAAHFDPGGGGRAIATDCHDASDSTGGLVASNPHCWVGGRDGCGIVSSGHDIARAGAKAMEGRLCAALARNVVAG